MKTVTGSKFLGQRLQNWSGLGHMAIDDVAGHFVLGHSVSEAQAKKALAGLRSMYKRRATMRLSAADATDLDNVTRALALRIRKGKVANPARKVSRAKAIAVCQCAGGKVANPDDLDAKTRFTLRREPLNSGGYDRYGEYFGRGAPLFVYEGEVPTSSRDVYGDTHRSQRDVRGHVRAADRESAMEKIRQKYPMARFFGEKRKRPNPARPKPRKRTRH